MLQRHKKIDDVLNITDLRTVFKPRTFAQISLTWKTYFQELRQIENAKKVFMKNNCFDIERVYFQLDSMRKGYFDRYDLKLFLIENKEKFGTIIEDEIDFIMSFFDLQGLSRVVFDDFVS